MCGIAGYVGDVTPHWLAWACGMLRHRGPDGEGLYVDPRGSAGLAHRRLAILDLSEAGRQPMATPDGRYHLSYNGELYNFRELRADLQSLGHTFRSKTDTEVVLVAWQEWGVDALLRFNGIFAFAIWDSVNHEMVLVRDPLGVKPLYWTRDEKGTLYFASELTPLATLPHVARRLDLRALEAYLAFLWVPSPMTIYRSVQLLPPGFLLRFRPHHDIEPTSYTNLYEEILQQSPRRHAAPGPEEVWDTLQTCVRRQLVSDVPIGIFLSGGLDSTGLVAACAEGGHTALTAYTATFSERDSVYEASLNDLYFAREVAKTYRIPHKVLPIHSDISRTLPEYIARMDQPVGDHAPLASYLICQAAAGSAKVLLSGQGADELFAGYPWHRAGYYSFFYHRLPRSLRHAWLEPMVKRLPGGVGGKRLGNLRRIKRFFQSASDPWPDRYVGFCRYLPPSRRRSLLNGGLETAGDPGPEDFYRQALHEAQGLSPLGQMLYTDLKTFLPGLNLFYTDRTGMAHGIEVRVPYLDLEMVRLAFQVPDPWRLSLSTSKKILKQALHAHVPASIIARKKTGFGLPVRSWMRTSLLPMMQEHLSPAAVLHRGLWEPTAIHQLLQEHLSGREDRAYLLFALLAFEFWMQTHLDQPVLPIS